MNKIRVVNSLFRGTPKKELNVREISAIGKNEVTRLIVKKDKIEGDQVANLKHHGGLNRVLHQYAEENYDYWKVKFPESEFSLGCMGENLSARGMNEENVCIGDRYLIGEVECVVTEPRRPCVTIDQKLQVKGMAKEVLVQRRTGWFYKIINEGSIQLGDELRLKDRLYPRLTLSSCTNALFLENDVEILELMAKNSTLSETWRIPALKKLK